MSHFTNDPDPLGHTENDHSDEPACPDCGGSGVTYDFDTCPSCNGTGDVLACEVGRPWEPLNYGPGCWCVGRRVGNGLERHDPDSAYMPYDEALRRATELNAGVLASEKGRE